MYTFFKIALVWLAVAAGLLAAQPALAQDGETPAAPAANPTVTIGHFAPFAADVASTAVDVRVNGTAILTGMVYGNYVDNVEFPVGSVVIDLLTPGTETVIVSATAQFNADTSYYLLAIGGANGFPSKLIQTPVITAIPAGKALVTLGHLAPVTGLTAVNICTDDGDLVVTVNYGEPAANLPLDPGFHDWKIWVLGCSLIEVFDMPPFFIAAGDYRDAFAIGLRDSLAFPPNIVTTTGLLTLFNYLPTIHSSTSARSQP
ncbi:MAG: DUF4397 domain-containing protein [Tetrasphaera sp.]